MIFCNNCGAPNPDGARFCAKCGKPVSVGQASAGQGGQTRQGGGRVSRGGHSSWIDSLNNYVGNDRPADLNWRVLFTDVFKKHTTDEAEEIFICGTKTTTPDPANVSKDWPHPWLYSRVLAILLAATLILWICVSQFANSNALPGMIVMGSFAVPIATMILFMELNAWRNVSVYYVFMIFLVGGCASLLAALPLYRIYGPMDIGRSYFDAFAVGFIEEIAKAIIAFVFIKRIAKLNILAGMLIGACVGAGFAAFESAGYAMNPVMQFLQNSGFAAAYGQRLDSSMMLDGISNSLFIRGILAPGGHVAWAAISGVGIIIAAKARGTMDSKLLLDGKFLRLFMIPVVLHALWDSPLQNSLNRIFPFCGVIALLVAVWIVVLMLINMGLAEVSRTAETSSQKTTEV